MTSIKHKCRTCIHCDVDNLICRPNSKDCRSEYTLDIHDLDTAEPCDFYEKSLDVKEVVDKYR
jgi:hypothetical protein